VSVTLDKWLLDEGIPGICGVDTRRLTRVLRERGVMLSAITTGDDVRSIDIAKLEDPNRANLVKEVSVRQPIVYGGEYKDKVVLIDCGVKTSIIRK